jgi:hypothetical protein
MKKIKRQDAANKGLISRIHKESSKSQQKITNQIDNGPETTQTAQRQDVQLAKTHKKSKVHMLMGAKSPECQLQHY